MSWAPLGLGRTICCFFASSLGFAVSAFVVLNTDSALFGLLVPLCVGVSSFSLANVVGFALTYTLAWKVALALCVVLSAALCVGFFVGRRRARELARLQGGLNGDEAVQEAIQQSLLDQEAQGEEEEEPQPFRGALKVYASFEEQMRVVCQELLDAGQLKKEDVESMMPSALTSLTAVVILRALLRSMDTQGLRLADGTVVRDADMLQGDWGPKSGKELFQSFKELRGALEGLRPSDGDKAWMERRLLLGGDVEVSDERRAVADVCTKINGMQTTLTRLVVFKKRGMRLWETLGRLMPSMPSVVRALSRTLSTSSSAQA